MGGGLSQEDYDRYALEMYRAALHKPCLLPDISIDESLMKYSGINSTTELQTYSDLQVGIVPDFIDRLGSSLAGFNAVPNAVGLGALVISMIIELIIKGIPHRENTYDMFRRVFGEEKASAVRDTMSESIKRHHMFMNDDRVLGGELRRLEAQLSNHLTTLRNSLLHDNQMSTRGFKIWANGAAFHVQMMIHEARLGVQNGRPNPGYVRAISAAIDLYLTDLDHLTEKYKTFWLSKTRTVAYYSICYVSNSELNCRATLCCDLGPCLSDKVIESYINHAFTTYEPMSGMKGHFSNIKTNLTILINQHHSFTLPSAA